MGFYMKVQLEKWNYKSWSTIVTQGFLHRLGINYKEMYSPIMDINTFQFLISLMILEGMNMCLMDIVTTYLYESIDNDIYMKIFKGYYKSW